MLRPARACPKKWVRKKKNKSLPIITALKAQKNKKRVNIYLDGKFSFGLNLEEVVKNKLVVGAKLGQEQINKLCFTDQTNLLYQKTLNYLSFRPRSEKEIIDYLKHRLFKLQSIEAVTKEQVISSILQKLKRRQLVDNEQFGRWWIEQRLAHRPRGKRYLEAELRQKGLSRELTLMLTAQISPKEVTQSIKKIIAKKVKLFSSLAPVLQRQKLINYLLAKGYDFEQILPAIDEKRKK